jgi:hypothetical protein
MRRAQDTYTKSMYELGLTLKDVTEEQRNKIESDMRPHKHVWVFDSARIERRHLAKN